MAPRTTYLINDTTPTESYTLSLHDALPICAPQADDENQRNRTEFDGDRRLTPQEIVDGEADGGAKRPRRHRRVANVRDRKSTRLNSSHMSSSYAVFCLKKKNYRSSLGHTVT